MPIKSAICILFCAVALTGLTLGPHADPLSVDDKDVTPPEKTIHVDPVYPEEAREAGVQGSVKVEMVIGESGSVERTEVKESNPAFDKATIEAVKQWKYRPATLEGKPVSVFMTVVVRFRLE